MKGLARNREQEEGKEKGTYDLEALEELLANLIEASGQGAATIVEGRRDLLALRALGLTGPVIMASRRSALDLAEEAARSYQEIILLTDWDRKGDEMARIIERHLRSVGSRPDREIRSRIKMLVRKEIKDVESLHNYIERMRYLYGP
mgnify:CR=1 FL=1